MKYFLPGIALAVILNISPGMNAPVTAQIYRMGAGFCFASGYDFNTIGVGNPGLRVKTWIALDRKSTLHIVPALTAFNRNFVDAGYFNVANYAFHGDVDGQYMVFKDGTLKMVVFAGGNISYLTSTVEQSDPQFPIPENAPDDTRDAALGANLGAGLELRMASHWDMNLSAKYIVSKYSQFIISIEGVYYFKSRRKAYRR